MTRLTEAARWGREGGGGFSDLVENVSMKSVARDCHVTLEVQPHTNILVAQFSVIS